VRDNKDEQKYPFAFIHVGFVAYQNFIHIVGSMLLNIPNPISYIVERRLVSNIIDEQNAHCSPVVGSCNSSETFLASSIPDLQLYALTIKFNCSYFEVDPNGGDKASGEGAI